jgi:hypothetical protein
MMRDSCTCDEKNECDNDSVVRVCACARARSVTRTCRIGNYQSSAQFVASSDYPAANMLCDMDSLTSVRTSRASLSVSDVF